MSNKNSLLEKSIQNSNPNRERGHGLLDLPIMLSGLIVGTGAAGMVGYRLAHGDSVRISEIALFECVGLIATTLGWAGFCNKKNDLVCAPAVYTGLSIIAGAAGYAVGYLLRDKPVFL